MSVTPGRRRHRRWAPRVWLGCSFRSWYRLLFRYRFAVGPQHLHTAAIDTAVSLFNTTLGALEHLIYGRKIASTEINPQPLFILGHWRSGTTLLHDLICLDPRYAGPTVYQCCSPHHFLLSETVLPRLLWFLMPDKRPVDEMGIDWNATFEDEFALCLLGARSPYETIAFPNSRTLGPDMLNPDGLTAAEAGEWHAIFVHFLKKLTLRHGGRRLVLKSPPHTCRIRVLLELFPHARFVHIVRNPYDVFPSTKHLWRTLHKTQGLQNPDNDPTDEMVLSTLLHVHECLERNRSLIPTGQFHQLRYEDLVGNPGREMRQMYEHLQIGAFDKSASSVETYFADRATYTTNRYHLTDAQRHAIGLRAGRVIDQYGYGDNRQESNCASSFASN